MGYPSIPEELKGDFEEFLKSKFGQNPAVTVAEDVAAPVVHAVSDAVKSDPYVQQLEAHIAALTAGAIAPRTDTVVPTADPRDAEIAELQKALVEIRAQLAKNAVAPPVNPDAPAGGAPIPFHLHLDDGSMVQGHPGNPTQLSMPDGTVRQVVAAYPSANFQPKEG